MGKRRQKLLKGESAEDRLVRHLFGSGMTEQEAKMYRKQEYRWLKKMERYYNMSIEEWIAYTGRSAEEKQHADYHYESYFNAN